MLFVLCKRTVFKYNNKVDCNYNLSCYNWFKYCVQWWNQSHTTMWFIFRIMEDTQQRKKGIRTKVYIGWCIQIFLKNLHLDQILPNWTVQWDYDPLKGKPQGKFLQSEVWKLSRFPLKSPIAGFSSDRTHLCWENKLEILFIFK